MAEAREITEVVLVTGLSGAGRSSALKCLEDLGYEAIDNVPLSLLPNLLQPVPNHPEEGPTRALAVCVDSRTRAFNAERFIALYDNLLARSDIAVRLLFLDAADSVLIRRFTETRRRHPLATDRPIRDGIAQERSLMAALRDRCDTLIDTSDLTGHQLRQTLTKQFGLDGDTGLAITVTSFSYARGLPRDADLVFDVRFLRNPHYVDDLRSLTGVDSNVTAYVESDDAFDEFWQRITDLILMLLPGYQSAGKTYLTIAFGCTGGRHRSVVLAERFSSLLRGRNFGVTTVHRDI